MNRTESRRKAHDLVAKMTIEERASQLRFDSPGIERLGVPPYNWWNEALHGVARFGVATMYPQPIGLGATFDPALLGRIGDQISTEGRGKHNEAVRRGDYGIYKGLTYWSPNINIFRDPRWGRGHETYGEDPFLTSRLGVEFVKGLQGDGAHLKAAACAKHFAVHSGPEKLRHEFNAEVSQKDLFETYLPAFEALVTEAKVEAVMGAYNRTNGDPCCGSWSLLVDILRGRWGFEGHVVSDCMAVKDFHDGHKVTPGPMQSVKLALESGCDCNCGCTYQHVMNAYKAGLISEEIITRSCERLFTTRFLLGIVGDECSEFDSIPYSVVEAPEHMKTALEAAHKSVVMLKNDGTLPLKADKLGTIGVIGPNANSREALYGNYQSTASRYVTVLEGIQDEVKSIITCGCASAPRVMYTPGAHIWRDCREGPTDPGSFDSLSEAAAVADRSDVVIAVVGLDCHLEGEEFDFSNDVSDRGDKKSLLLPLGQRKMLQTIAASGKPFVIVLMAGSAIDLGRDIVEKASAILVPWYPGAQGGVAVADILFGRVSPSGKLPVTFYHNDDPIGEFTDYSMKGRTYRYLEKDPLFPFGFGLTYGKVNVISAEVGSFEPDGSLTISAKVRNSGSCGTEEVVQVYIKDTVSPLAIPNHSLCAFSRVHLDAGEELEISLTIPSRAFSVVNEAGERVPGGPEYTLSIGVSQPTAQSIALTGSTPYILQVTTR